MTEPTAKKKESKAANALIAANMQMNGGGLVLRSANELKVTAELFFSGGLVPPSLNSMPKIACVVEAGLELGFKPWQSIQNLHIVNGQIGIKSTAIGGLIRSMGKCKEMRQFYEGKKGTDEHTAVIISQRTDDATEHRTEFSVADAKMAGLWSKDNWAKYPEDMLMWRALSRHGRQFYGDVLSGFYTVEELKEIQPPSEQNEQAGVNGLKERLKEDAEPKTKKVESTVVEPEDHAFKARQQEQIEKLKEAERAKAEEEQQEDKLQEETGPPPEQPKPKLMEIINQAFFDFQTENTDVLAKGFVYDKDKFIKAVYKHFKKLPTNMASVRKICDAIKPDEVTVEIEQSPEDNQLVWHCNNPRCGANFDWPVGTKNDLCPKCLLSDIGKNETTE